MRRKLYFGVALATLIVVAVGFMWNQTSGAQDAPKKAEPEPKKSEQDLFDLLRQKFEAKSDGPVLPPSKPIAPVPNLPLPTAQVPTQLPAPPPSSGGTIPPIPGPTAQPKPLNENVQQPLPSGPTTPPVQDLPKPQPLPTPTPLPTPSEIIPPLTSPPTQNVPLPKQDLLPQSIDATLPKVIERSADPVAPTPMPLNEPIKLKGSAWSLYVEMVNGQTVVTATVNKKHEFKIVCQHLDLQTGAGVMKAKGKVQITGDALNGSCDQLTLPLHDDRLVLEGAAEVRIQKVTTTTNVSDARPAAFELKGDKLDMRISELPSSAYIETSWRKVAGDMTEGKAIPASLKPGDDAQKWTPYGKLSNIKANETNVWSLVGSDGKIIAYVMARDGGSLEQYVGRTIAVFGAREGERGGYPLVRVTHIAVP
jgi:hypothetical protein